jgi:hypothetical protein
MKKLLQISLGIVTSVGGFLETGLIATSAQAGAAFGFQLIWAVILGTICLIFLVEMSGRFAIASHYTIADGIRDRFGSNMFIVMLAVTVAGNVRYDRGRRIVSWASGAEYRHRDVRNGTALGGGRKRCSADAA